jgi:uncharacterized protein involved in exopolysaccharide biosynthesis
MSGNFQILDQASESEEINLLLFLKILFNYWRTLTFSLFVGIGLGLFISTIMVPQYNVSASFFLHSGGNSRASSLGNVFNIFGPGKSESFEAYIFAITKSDLIKTKIAAALASNQLNQKDQIDLELMFTTQSEILGKLKLNKNMNMYKDNDGIFRLSYYSPNAQVSYDVVNAYIDNLQNLLYSLDIVGNRNIITILDKPTLPMSPFKPNKLLNILLTSIASLFFGILVAFTKESRSYEK